MRLPIINGYSEDQVMMTLSAIAYTSFDSLSTLQYNLNAAEALELNQAALWFSVNKTNLVYVVKNRVKAEYTIAIRGPVLRFGLPLLVELYDDLEVGHQVPLSYNKMGNGKIAAGILEAIQNIEDLSCHAKTLSQLINGFPREAKVYITGHGLGGTLAAALAVKRMSNNLNCLDIIPYTFAALSAGNHAFADLFDLDSEYCSFSHSENCVNSLDIIPYAWYDLHGIRTVDYGKIKCPIELTMCIDFISKLLLISRVPYAQPVRRLDLKGEITQKSGFYQEAMYQHQPNRYMELLGLNPIISSIYSSQLRKGQVLETTTGQIHF